MRVGRRYLELTAVHPAPQEPRNPQLARAQKHHQRGLARAQKYHQTGLQHQTVPAVLWAPVSAAPKALAIAQSLAAWLGGGVAIG